jgi:hypothetical protein
MAMPNTGQPCHVVAESAPVLLSSSYFRFCYFSNLRTTGVRIYLESGLFRNECHSTVGNAPGFGRRRFGKEQNNVPAFARKFYRLSNLKYDTD